MVNVQTKHNIPEIVRILEEKDQLMEEMESRIFHLQKDNQKLIQQCQQHQQMASKIRFSHYQQYIRNQNGEKLLIVKIKQDSCVNPIIHLSKNLQIVKWSQKQTSAEKVISGEKNSNDEEWLKNNQKKEELIRKISSGHQKKLDNGFSVNRLQDQITRLKEQLSKYQTIVQSERQIKQLQVLQQQQQLQILTQNSRLKEIKHEQDEQQYHKSEQFDRSQDTFLNGSEDNIPQKKKKMHKRILINY